MCTAESIERGFSTQIHEHADVAMYNELLHSDNEHHSIRMSDAEEKSRWAAFCASDVGQRCASVVCATSAAREAAPVMCVQTCLR